MGSLWVSVALAGAVVERRQEVKPHCRGLGRPGCPRAPGPYSARVHTVHRREKAPRWGLMPEVGCGPQKQCVGKGGAVVRCGTTSLVGWLLDPGVASLH